MERYAVQATKERFMDPGLVHRIEASLAVLLEDRTNGEAEAIEIFKEELVQIVQKIATSFNWLRMGI